MIIPSTHSSQALISRVHSCLLTGPNKPRRKIVFSMERLFCCYSTMSMAFPLNLSKHQLCSHFQHTCSLIIVVLSRKSESICTWSGCQRMECKMCNVFLWDRSHTGGMWWKNDDSVITLADLSYSLALAYSLILIVSWFTSWRLQFSG